MRQPTAASSLLLFAFFAVQQVLDFLKHGVYIAEGAIDAGEADIGDLIHFAQVVHDQFADDAAGNFLFALAIDFLLDFFNGVFDIVYRERPFLAGFADADEEFLAIKRFASQVTFNDHELGFLDSFVGAKAPFTLLAFATAMDGVAHIPRVFYA